MKFYLGVAKMSNQYVQSLEDIPFMISITRFLKYKKEIKGDFFLDSGGFTQLSMYGKYTITKEEYLDKVLTINPEIVFCQDWMTEDTILEKTGKNVKDHQYLTLESFLELNSKCKKIMPVLQGQSVEDYIIHMGLYKKAGVDFNNLIFGLGSVCRRKITSEIETIIHALLVLEPNIKLHGFGMKSAAFKSRLVVNSIYSGDSMAWSFAARMNKLQGKFCFGCSKKIGCADCINYAITWREEIVKKIKKTVIENPIFLTVLPHIEDYYKNLYR